jgi:hypothetical protein
VDLKTQIKALKVHLDVVQDILDNIPP